MPEKMNKADEVLFWRAELEAAENIVQSQLMPDWRKRLENWEGLYWTAEPGVDGHRGSVNMVWAITDLMQGALYFHDPRVVATAKKPGAEAKTRLAERLMNYYLEELDTASQVRRLIKDALLFDAGYMKLGYEVETDIIEELEAITDDMGNELYDDNDNAMLKDPQGNLYINRDGRFIQLMDRDGELVVAEQEHPTLHEYVRREQPYGVRWAPWDVLRDPRGRYVDLSDARWVAFRSIVPVEEVRNNPLYRGARDIEPNRTARSEVVASFEKYDLLTQDDERIACVELFEIWCREWNKAKRRYDIYQKVIAAGHDKFLLYRRSPYLAEGFPVAVLAFDEHPHRPYGWSPLRSIDPQIEALNYAVARETTLLDQQVQRWAYNAQFVDKEEAEEFASAPDGAVIALKKIGDPSIPIANVIHNFTVPQISPDIKIFYDRRRDEIQVVFGASDYQMGGSGGPSRQATEASLIQSGFSVRVEVKRGAVGKLVNRVARYWAQLLRQFGDYQMALRITNDVGQEVWEPFKVQDAVGDEVDFTVDTYPSMFQAREVTQKIAENRYNLLRNDQMVNPQKLIEDVFRASGVQDVTAYMAQQQPQVPGQPQPEVGPDGQPLPIESRGAAGQVVDLNQSREPAAIGAGATGRAMG